MYEKVKDLMQAATKVVNPRQPLVELERAFLAAKVSGFPVVDDNGRLIGVVSRSDIVRQLCIEQSLAEYVSDYYRDVHHYESELDETLADIGERVGQRIERLTVRDVMITKLITVTAETSLTEVAKLLIRHHIHRLPVVEHERLIGIISALDLVRLFAEQRVSPAVS